MADPVADGYLPFSLPDLDQKDWPTLRVGKIDSQAQISLENANFSLGLNRKVLFGGNGQISTVGDLSFLTGTPSPTEQLRIFANGNVGIGTGTSQPTDKLEIAGSLKLENGLSVNQFSGDITDSDQVVPTAKAVKTYVDSQLKLPDGSVTDSKIANNAVTTDKIADNSITAAKIKNGAITQEKLAASISLPIPDGSVGTAKLVSSAITTDKIADKSITEAKLNFSISPGGSQWSDLTGSNISYSKGNVGIGTGTSIPQAKLQVANGAIMPSVGNSETAGIMFPKDPYGGGGDAAWMRYYARTGEACTLEIGVSNDRDDHIALITSGNVGIGTTNPQATLHLCTPQTRLRLQSTQPTQNGNRGGIARIEFWSDPQGDKNEWQQAVIESSDSDDISKAFGGVISFYVNRSSKDTNGKRVDPKRVIFMTEDKVDIPVSLYVKEVEVKSSREIKENIMDFSSQEAMETLAGLNPVKFNYCDDKEKELTVGFIAEDVPDLLASHDRKGVRSLEIIAVLTKIVQQQQEELSCLKERLNALETRA